MDNPGHLPLDTTTAAPARSILKKKHSHDCGSHHTDCTVQSDSDRKSSRGAQWDEMNILATYHPADKDYGHMKIDDPPTPFHEYTQEPDDEMDFASAVVVNVSTEQSPSPRGRRTSFSDAKTEEGLDAEALAEKLSHPLPDKPSKAISSDSEDESHFTKDEWAKKQEFKSKRKHHYDEFQVGIK